MISGPKITIDLEKIRKNAKVITDFCGEHGIDVIGVTKVTCGIPLVARAMLEGGVVGIGESRLENINRLRASGINQPITLLRIPPLSGVDEIVASVDISLNSELPVIEELSLAADKLGKVHDIILMVDLGDLREGIWPDDLVPVTREVVELPGVKIRGLGTNLTCHGGVLPSEENMQLLVDLAHRIEDTFRIRLDIISGGNSSSLDLLRRGKMPKEINQLRLGESIMLGRETALGKVWPGTSTDAFILRAELIEIKEKPSVPIGETGMDAFGETPVFEDRGDMIRGILNIGREDVLIDGLTPVDENIEILGASSDHLLLNISRSSEKLKLGDEVGFTPAYGALLACMTSQYVSKEPLLPAGRAERKNRIVLSGDSPVFAGGVVEKRLRDIGYDTHHNREGATREALTEVFRSGAIPYIAGPRRVTLEGMLAMKDALGPSGLIIMDSHPSLMTAASAPKERKILSTALGLVRDDVNLRTDFSPENIVIIGLREAEKEETDLIHRFNIPVYTMEDVDLLGIREVIRRSLRRAAAGTHGVYLSFCQDVVDDKDEGLTSREIHLAMEQIAKSGLMRAIDISGCCRKGQTDFSSLIHFVESSFGKRILG
jgi:predicted amino acid racemase/arginase family enzyme